MSPESLAMSRESLDIPNFGRESLDSPKFGRECLEMPKICRESLDMFKFDCRKSLGMSGEPRRGQWIV